MKTKLPLALLVLVISVSLFSCDQIADLKEDLNTVSVDQGIDETIKLGDGDDGVGIEAGEFSTSFTIDLRESPEVAANQDRIKEVIIKYLAFQIVDFEGSEEATISDAVISFSDRVIPVQSLINLYDADKKGTEFVIGDDSDYLVLAEILKNELAVEITLSGNASEAINFNMKVIADTTIDIELLN